VTSYLVVGHVAEDLTPSGTVLGGTVLYAANLALGLGFDTRVVTSVTELSLLDIPGVAVKAVPTDGNTTFRHITMNGHRQSWLFKVASQIHGDDVPPSWRSSDIWHLGPIAHEIGPDMLDVIPPHAFVGLTPQGWLRHVGPDFRVSARQWTESGALVSRAGAVVISVDDVPDARRLGQGWSRIGPVVAVTEGCRGSVLYENGREIEVPPFAADALDEIGAGDVYAVALFSRLAAGDSPSEAGRFASAAAALSLSGRGPKQLPDRDQIRAFLESQTR
jgi:sugar/nucleoside kinase (ribokinase family)